MPMKTKKSENSEASNKIEDIIPILNFRDGILITDRDYVAFIEVMPVNFNLKSEREQLYIIEKYEELLKQFRVPFYIFTIAKKADSKAHLDYIYSELETELNASVCEMIREYMEYVKKVSLKSAVKRRFIVAIPYQAADGIKDGFDEIQRWLMQKCISFKEAIDKCGNDTIISEDNRFTAEILYELLNVKSSERERIPEL